MPSSVSKRRSLDSDRAFLYELYLSTRSDEVEAFGWDAAMAEAFLASQFNARERVYAFQFPASENQIALIGDVEVGRILVDRTPSALHLIDIAILTEYRRQGIGFELIELLKTEAEVSSRGVSLTVDRTAESALCLYRKAGFSVTAESQLNFEMEWQADGRRDSLHVSLRPATDDDRDLLISIYEASRESELALTDWGSEQRRAFAELQFEGQTRHYREYYPNATHNIIVKDNCRAGRLYVNRGETEFAILDLTVLPVFRRSGIATYLVRELQADAQDQGRSVRVFVEAFNPSQKLFSKLGFSITGSEGVNFRMEWNQA